MINWAPQVLCVFGRGIEKVNGVTVHLPRCQEFAKHVPPELLEGVELRWFASEPIVLRHLPVKHDYLWEAMISPAYARTAERERRGITDLRAGKYNFSSQSYGFAPPKS